MSKHWRWGIRKALRAELTSFLKNPTKVMKKNMKVYTKNGSDLERYVSDEHVQRMFIECGLDNALTDNGVETEAREYALFGANWGFDLGAIACPVYQWSGSMDRGSVPNIAKHLQDTIPNCESKLVDGKGHLVFFDVWNEILDKAIAE